jgi:hypothetical protein
MSVVQLPSPPEKPHFFRISDSYFILECEREGMHLHAQRVTRNKYGELRCTLEVRSALAGTPLVDEKQFVLNRYDNVNLSAPGSRKTLAADLERSAKTKGDQINWHRLLDTLAFQVSSAEQTGEPAVLLSSIERPITEPLFDVEGFRLLKHHPTIVFGDGGSMKSYLALYWAGRLQQMGARVAMFDWELDAADHKERSVRLFGHQGPELVYVRCSRPLVYEIDRLVQIKHDHQIDYVICDSIAFACHGKPEDAEIACGYFRAIRQLGIGSLHLAHITKGENGDQRPFGSTFWHNGARCTWFAKSEGVDETAGGRERTIGLFNRKVNMGAPISPVAFQFIFEPDRTTVRRVEPSTVQSLASEVPVWQRIKHAVRSGPLTIAELAAEIDAKPDTVEKAIRRKAQVFSLVKGANGVQRVALIERRVS